jgi:hypothetical protein
MAKVYTDRRVARHHTILSFQIVIEPCGQAFDHIAPVVGLSSDVAFAGINYQLRFHS